MSASDSLRRDLALVLPPVLHRADAVRVRAVLRSREVSVEEAITTAAKLLSSASAPAIGGLGWLSIEAVREAVALAEALRGCLFPDATPDPVTARMAVTQTATLGHIFACDSIIWIGTNLCCGPIAEAIAARIPRSISIEDKLEPVLALRTANLETKNVGVILPAGVDPCVTSQWHKLAADAQQRGRIAVITLPDPQAAPNAKGAHEVVCWQTGLSLHLGAISFADGAPRIEPVRDADVLVDAGYAQPTNARRIHLGREPDPKAEVSFVIPGLAIGLAAQITRFDGVILWLCDHPATAPPDPAVQLLSQIRQQL